MLYLTIRNVFCISTRIVKCINDCSILSLLAISYPFTLDSSIIFDRLADGGRTYQQATTMHLSNYAEDGLRTMLFAYKQIDVTEYENWNLQFMKAKATIGFEREELIEAASEIIEKNLYLLGAVAVDDKLQDGVSSLSQMHCLFHRFF